MNPDWRFVSKDPLLLLLLGLRLVVGGLLRGEGGLAGEVAADPLLPPPLGAAAVAVASASRCANC